MLPAGDEHDVVAGADRLEPAEREAAVEPRDLRAVVLADPVVHRPGQVPGGAQRAGHLAVIGRRDHGDAGLHPHHGDVLEAVVADALRAVLEAAADADDAHRQPVPDGSVADELVGTQRREGHDRVDERDEARLGQAGGDSDHVLLGHADVEEPVREALGERLERHVAEIAGEQQDAIVRRGDLAQRADECAPHAPRSCSSISATARRYSSSDIGQ